MGALASTTKLRCSRWCGCGCTQAQYERAVADGKALLLTLGRGWRIDVWENGGWHYKAVSGVAEISPNIRNWPKRKLEGYTCFFQSKPQIVTKGATAHEALNAAVAEARAIAESLTTHARRFA